MPNPMMQMLMGGGSRRPNNPLAMMAEFRRFAAGMTPQKAQQEIERLLTSGQMSKEQFADLQNQAKDFMQFLK
jgi:hypothetical protein